MKLHNVIIVHDVYVVAETEEDAIKTVLDGIHTAEEPLKPSEQVAIEATDPRRSVRAAWCDERPFVGASISDADFETLKGKSTLDVCKMIYTKPEPEKK